MKKSLLALAVLGAFAGTASAQSSVTVYGSIDMSVAKSNGGTAPNLGAPGDGIGKSKAWTVQQSNESRLGFRGNEDLGGGLSAQFQIEHRFAPDTGGLPFTFYPFWQGRSFVQLTSAKIGSVYLGRDYTPAFWPAVKSDPFGWDGVGQMSLGQYANYLTPGTGLVRTDNTVGFKSASFGGLTVQGAIGASEDTGRGRNNGFNVEYAGGPIYAGFGYEKVTKGLNDGNGLINFALHYNLGFVNLMGYYAQSKTNLGANKHKVYQFGATAPLGSGLLKAGYYRVDPQGTGNVFYNNNSSKIGLGYDYQLSKRTGLYADLGMAREKTKTNNTSYAFGVKHTF